MLQVNLPREGADHLMTINKTAAKKDQVLVRIYPGHILTINTKVQE